MPKKKCGKVISGVEILNLEMTAHEKVFVGSSSVEKLQLMQVICHSAGYVKNICP